MSTYFTIQARLVYEDKPAFDTALKLLTGWVTGDGSSESPYVIHSENDSGELDGFVADPNKLLIIIPVYVYRNLGRLLNDPRKPFLTKESLFNGAVWPSKAIWSSDDGMFDGGVCHVDKRGEYHEQHTDLRRWGQVNVDPVIPEQWDDYVQWMGEVEQSYHDTKGEDLCDDVTLKNGTVIPAMS